MVATDIAARGIDVEQISHVINYDVPHHPEDYVHRIGRTGRAGAKGRAFTFVSEEDAEAIGNVEKLTQAAIPVFGKKDLRVELTAPVLPQKPAAPEEEPASRERRERPVRAERPAAPRKPEPRRPRRDERAEEPSPPGEWNGPVPSFLTLSAL
jgi:superfamily II DNA/RNA helicase